MDFLVGGEAQVYIEDYHDNVCIFPHPFSPYTKAVSFLFYFAFKVLIRFVYN
jgi:hypothetical protein